MPIAKQKNIWYNEITKEVQSDEKVSMGHLVRISPMAERFEPTDQPNR